MCWRRIWELKLLYLHPLFLVRHLVCNLSAATTCQSLISHAHQRPALPIVSHLHLHFSVKLHAKYLFPEVSRAVLTYCSWLFFFLSQTLSKWCLWRAWQDTSKFFFNKVSICAFFLIHNDITLYGFWFSRSTLTKKYSPAQDPWPNCSLVYVRPAFCHVGCCYLYNNYL